MNSILAFVIFFLIALVACAFVAWPILRRRDESIQARLVLAGAASLLVLGIGGGSYLVLGHPGFAVRTLEGTDATNVDSLIPLLVDHVHKKPTDLRAWVFLGRAYLTVHDPIDASKALARALAVAEHEHALTPDLLSAYGESLVEASGGVVTPDAEVAFHQTLSLDPHDLGARFYLGLAYAARGENSQALALWQSMLADTPPNAPWRGELVDRIASLSAKAGAAPDIAAMVQGLAERLKQVPDDAGGWQRLIRAYAVLGQRDKAKDALATARAHFAAQPDVSAALDEEAKSLKL